MKIAKQNGVLKKKKTENGVAAVKDHGNKENHSVNTKKTKKKKGGHLNGDELPLVRHKEGGKWYDYQIEGRVEDAAKDGVSAQKTQEMAEEAEALLQKDILLYKKFLARSGGSEATWLQSVLHTGTHGDRLTAMGMQIKNSPVHSLSFLQSMVHTIEKKNVREGIQLIPVVEEICIEELLPPHRKLLSFSSRPLARLDELSHHSIATRKRTLLLWIFEHRLKIIFERFTKSLETLAGGAVESLCTRSLLTAQRFLIERPENEQFLLTMLVNKLGHPNKKVALRTESLLLEVATKQPKMRAVLVTEIERLIYRRNVSGASQAAAASVLSRLLLRAGESDLAVHLLTIYFGLFKTLVAEKRNDNKLLCFLLTGANRAFPYAKEYSEKLSDEIDSLYRLVHTTSFAVSLQTLKLLFHILNLTDSLTERFYSALYRKLLDPIPTSCQQQLLSLLSQALLKDQSDQRVRAFVKRILQLACVEMPPFAAALLITVSELVEKRNQLLCLSRPAQNILLVDEITSAKPTIKRENVEVKKDKDGEDQKSEKAAEEVNEDEEVYVDLDDEGRPLQRISTKAEMDNSVGSGEKKDIRGLVASKKNAGWMHRSRRGDGGFVSIYDASCRNPLFASSLGCLDAELRCLSSHFHPSIQVFANSLLRGEAIRYSGDPFVDFTTISFLDRFVYRKPKVAVLKKTSTGTVKKIQAPPRGIKALSVASKEYSKKRREEIPADERFLHRFASMRWAQKKSEGGEAEVDEEEVGSVNSEEFDQIMARFEPGEANDQFDIDFGEEFMAEKQKKKATKRKANEKEDKDEEETVAEGVDEDDEENWEEEEWSEEEEGVEESEEEEDEEEEEDIPAHSSAGSRSERRRRQQDEEDDDSEGDDVFVSADRFGEAMEDFNNEFEPKMQKKSAKRNKQLKMKRRK